MHCRCTDAVATFLAEAVAQATRRPHELWELTQRLLASPTDATETSEASEGLGSQLGFSELTVSCLRNVLRVVASPRMPSDARAAIASYAAGVPLCPCGFPNPNHYVLSVVGHRSIL